LHSCTSIWRSYLLGCSLFLVSCLHAKSLVERVYVFQYNECLSQWSGFYRRRKHWQLWLLKACEMCGQPLFVTFCPRTKHASFVLKFPTEQTKFVPDTK
jgi:hypothetical protein